MIKAVIFDLGGVVFRDGTKYTIEEMKEKFSFSEELGVELLLGKEARDFRKGLLTSEEFWDYVQSKIPSKIKANEIRLMWYNNYVPFPGILDLIKKLKSKFKLGIISGNIKERIEYLDKKYDFRKYFDAEVYSFDLHITKPATLMWEKSLELLKLRAEECIYLDDQAEAVNTAKSMGYKAIQFMNVNQAKKELVNLGIKV
ncbi:HAD family phosphatase [Candidatus Pacearchaeota archaeon]|nr:HAD family phosphatase [Candidatus Pacearchaeota archaeon]